MNFDRKAVQVALLVMGVVTAFACSRSANQTNFLGKPCTGGGDCPPELLCAVGACREPCGPNGACATGATCQLGACIPGGAQQGGAAGGATSDASVRGGGGGGGGSTGSDGTTARSGLPLAPKELTGDDEWVAYSVTDLDDFGNQRLTLQAARLNSTAPPFVVSSLYAMVGPPRTAVVDGRVYWNHYMPPGATGTLRRAVLGQANPATEDIGSTDGYLERSGDKLIYLDGSKQLRVYDAKTSTLDPTIYGAGIIGGRVGLTESTVYWLNDDGTGNTVWKATLGAPGAATSRTIPNGDFSSFGAFGNRVFLTVSATGALLAFDTTSTATQQNLATTTQGGSGAQTSFAYDGGFLFAATSGTGPGDAIVRFSLKDGSQTKVGMHSGSGNSRAIYVTPTGVYVPEADGTGSRLARWPKPL